LFRNELSAKDRSFLVGAATKEGIMDLELVQKGGLEPFDPPGPVALRYLPTGKDSCEYLLEIQASVRVPGKKAAVPDRKIFTVRATIQESGSDSLRWEFKILDARKTMMSKGEGGRLSEFLVPDEEMIGAIVPLVTDLQGRQDRNAGLLSDDRALEWLRILLPTRPRKVGFGWRTLLPQELGSRREKSDGLYLLHRLVRLPGGQEVAVLRGRFRSRGGDQGNSRFQKQGQDRVLFDLARGRVLYREFRMQGVSLRSGKKGRQTFQARIKGLLMEKSLLKGLKGQQKIDRLNAANAVFGG
jgi:hypothetical protein